MGQKLVYDKCEFFPLCKKYCLWNARTKEQNKGSGSYEAAETKPSFYCFLIVTWMGNL